YRQTTLGPLQQLLIAGVASGKFTRCPLALLQPEQSNSLDLQCFEIERKRKHVVRARLQQIGCLGVARHPENSHGGANRMGPKQAKQRRAALSWYMYDQEVRDSRV